jgi:hypothetical protein
MPSSRSRPRGPADLATGLRFGTRSSAGCHLGRCPFPARSGAPGPWPDRSRSPRWQTATSPCSSSSPTFRSPAPSGSPSRRNGAGGRSVAGSARGTRRPGPVRDSAANSSAWPDRVAPRSPSGCADADGRSADATTPRRRPRPPRSRTPGPVLAVPPPPPAPRPKPPRSTSRRLRSSPEATKGVPRAPRGSFGPLGEPRLPEETERSSP